MPQLTPARSSPGLEDSITGMILRYPLLLLSSIQEQQYLYKKLYNQAIAMAPQSIANANPPPFDLVEEAKLFDLGRVRPELLEKRAHSLQFQVLFRNYPSNLTQLNNCLKRINTVLTALTRNDMDVAMPLESIIINNYTQNYQTLSMQLAIFQLNPTIISQKILNYQYDNGSNMGMGEGDNDEDNDENVIEFETQHATRLHHATPSSDQGIFITASHITSTTVTKPLPLPANVFSILQLYTPILRTHPLFTPTLNTQWTSKAFVSNQSMVQFVMAIIGNARHHPHNQRIIQKLTTLDKLSSLPPDPLRLAIRTTFNPNDDYLPPNVHELLYVNLHDYQQQTVNWSLREERATYNINRHVYEPIITGTGRLLWVSIPHLLVRTHLPIARRGGICALDMGGGKTLIAIALIAANPRPLRSPYSWQEEHEKQWDGGNVIISANLLLRQLLLHSQTQSVYDNPLNTLQENVYGLIQHDRLLKAAAKNGQDPEDIELSPALQAFDPLGTQLRYYTQSHVKMTPAMVSDAKNILKIITFTGI